MSEKATNKVATSLNELMQKAINDHLAHLQPRLSRLKKQAVHPYKPSEDELRSLEWASRTLPQTPPPSGIRGDSDLRRCQITTHHHLAGLNVEPVPPDWTEEPASFSGCANEVMWAKAEDAALGIGAAVGERFGCTHTGVRHMSFEINGATSGFTWDHQLLPISERPRFVRHRLRLTVKLEVPIPAAYFFEYRPLEPKGQDEIVGVYGGIHFILQTTNDVMPKSVDFLTARQYGPYGAVTQEYKRFILLSVEVPFPADMTSYSAGIVACVSAYRSWGGKGFAGINLAGPDVNMWIGNPDEGAGPIIVHYVQTRFCPELQQVLP